MPLNNWRGRRHFLLIALLIISQAYPWLVASATATDAEHSYIIFQDDFEDGEAEDCIINLASDAPLGSGWAVELDDGNYVLSIKGASAFLGDFIFTDYSFEVKSMLTSPNAGGYISMRFSGDKGHYGFSFSERRLVLSKYIKETMSDVEVYVADDGLDLNVWYAFKIICVGNSIEVYIDDVLKFSYVDEEDPILSGNIWFEGQTESHTYFDDVKVSTTHRLYVTHLINEAEDEINEARGVSADTVGAEEKLANAQDAFDTGNLSGAESLAKEAINLAQHASVGVVSVTKLLMYPAEYDEYTVEIYGTIKGIQYEQGVYRFAVDDGTAAISVTFDGTLEGIENEDDVKVVGIFSASTETVVAETSEKITLPTEGLYTFLVFKDDFEDGDFADWRINLSPEVEGSAACKVEIENGNHVLNGGNNIEAFAGDPEWVDYTLELKIKLIEGSVHIIFRSIEKPDYAGRYNLHLSHTYLTLGKAEEESPKPSTFSNLKQVGFELDPDVWYHLKIFCLENEIMVYINDNLKLEYTDEDNPILSGSIGFGIGGESSAHILFDDVKVSKITTTSVISDLITYAQSEIDKAKEINADVNAAELKFEQAKQALDQEDYQMVQYLVDETVWLAKRASIGQISITNLKVMATSCSGHVVTITGTVKNLEANYGAGYNFLLDDGTDTMPVTYQGALMDIENNYAVTVTGIFDASTQGISASRLEKITDASTSPPDGNGASTLPPGGITLSIELVATLISILGVAAGAGGWIIRTQHARKRKKVIFTKLMEDIDDVYSRFKKNALQCEAELYKFKDQILEDFKQGLIDEKKQNILNERIDNYLKEVKEKIAKEKTA